MKVDSGVSYNGSYYSVKGKYGEVMIANKHYPLSPDFNPGEDPEAVSALHELIAAMQAEGYPISDQYSGFRSYDTQVGLYQNYVNQDGQEAADRYSARPGYSEHQTGLTFDLIDTSGNLVTEPGPSKWLLKNAAKYGFVVRYQEGKRKSNRLHARKLASPLYRKRSTRYRGLRLESGRILWLHWRRLR